MSFDDITTKSKSTESHPVLLTQIRLIEPDDCELLQQLKAKYAQLTEESNLNEKITLSLLTMVLMQKRLYFAFTCRSMLTVLKNNPNLGKYTQGFSFTSWARIMAHLYNVQKVISLVQKGSTKNANAYRLERQDVAKYLLSLGVDGAQQKAETIEFCNRKFKVSKEPKTAD